MFKICPRCHAYATANQVWLQSHEAKCNGVVSELIIHRCLKEGEYVDEQGTGAMGKKALQLTSSRPSGQEEAR